ncbi:hypothetical protein [Hymenobacter sp. GOD-10R]|uniref:hypothetical protein n=1 Tax=Hymenobacter sp. GOD-10R TaxID=3093922 RepID=UPI002D776A66|nr:hypothetical protein [Hymenobacter sp. GOD-10R]WRQ27890.1 hypothetical protein SD425_22725 [Hymenobacter sp. GOD-10R]
MDSKKNQPAQDPDLASTNTSDSLSGSTDLGSAATADSSSDAALEVGDEGVQPAPQAAHADAQADQQPSNLFDSTIDALNLGAVGDTAKKWLDQSNLKETVNQLPQSLKDLGTKATAQVNKLSTTQKIVGGALLLGGIGWLSMRSKSGKNPMSKSSKEAYRGSSAGYTTGGKFTSGDSYGSRYGSTSSYSSPGTVNDSSYRGTSQKGSSKDSAS